jgi:hypothetical protein
VSITPDHANFIEKAEYDKYVADHIMFKDMSADSFLLSAGIAGDWPYGRAAMCPRTRASSFGTVRKTTSASCA